MAKIYPLSEGVFTVGHDKQFHPFDTESDELTERSRGSLLVEIQPFLVVTDKDVILFDTGLGYANEEGELQIHANLAKHGYNPEDVTKVLMSHLHKDHAGGVVYKDKNGLLNTSFPNADYYVYRQEADFALEQGYPSFHTQDIDPLLSSHQVQWLEEEQGEIDGYIKYFHSGGHSPYHIVYLIDDGTDKVFFGGDEAPQLKQMKIKYVAKYDYDGKKALALREQYAEQGAKEGWQFLFYHDVGKPVATL
ncbi:MAG: MBL fold metallo-hydrolase [Chitinophagales bacterium]|nr:MBL fold metallo-hydrolase [Chitinophagaceae bacterium]MCB9064587.1 MBL fold metallo-hydrolase [Chitinophagales bacterium]